MQKLTLEPVKSFVVEDFGNSGWTVSVQKDIGECINYLKERLGDGIITEFIPTNTKFRFLVFFNVMYNPVEVKGLIIQALGEFYEPVPEVFK